VAHLINRLTLVFLVGLVFYPYVFALIANAEETIEPSISQIQAIIYGSQGDLRIYPEVIEIRYSISINIAQSHQPGYSPPPPMVDIQWIYPSLLPRYAEIQGIGVASISYLGSYSYSAPAENKTYTYIPEPNVTVTRTVTNVTYNVYIDLRILISITPYSIYGGDYRLGDKLREIFGGDPVVRISVDVAGYSSSKTYKLDLSPVVLKVSGISIYVKSIELAGYEASSRELPATIYPLYDITVCHRGSGMVVGNPIRLSISGSQRVSEMYSVLSFDERCDILRKVDLQPSSNTSIRINYMVIDYSGYVESYRAVNGIVLSIPQPSVSKIISGGSAKLQASIAISSSGYGDTASVSASMSSNGYYTSCGVVSINAGDSRELSCVIENINPEVSSAAIQVSAAVGGNSFQLSWSGSPLPFDPVRIEDLLVTMLGWFKTVLAMVMLVGVAMYALSWILYLVGAATPILDNLVRILDQVDVLQIVMFSALLLIVIYVGIPATYSLIYGYLSSLGYLRSVPYCGSANPEDAIRCVGRVIDTMFSDMSSDYNKYVIANLNSAISKAAQMLVIASALALAAIAAGVFLGIGTVAGLVLGNISSSIFSFGLSVLTMFATVLPAAAIALIGIQIAPMILAIIVMIIMLIVFVGAALIMIPVPGARDYGYTFIGEGVMLSIALPAASLIARAIYDMIVRIADQGVSVDTSWLGQIAIYTARIFFPIDELFKIVVFYTGAGVSIAVLLGTVAIILSRTGIAHGIGEALVSLVSRR